MEINAPRNDTEIGDMADIGSMNRQVNPFGQHPAVRAGKGDRMGIEIPVYKLLNLRRISARPFLLVLLVGVCVLGSGVTSTGNEREDFDDNNSGTGWRLLDVRTQGPCIESSMVWDPVRKVLVLHTGRTRKWHDLAETWEWAPGAAEWSRVVNAEAENPGKRQTHGMVWDSKRERMLLFGGMRHRRRGGYDYLNDTWAYDSKTHTWVQLNTTANPPGRSQHGMVYDPERDEILLFGGRDAEVRKLNDTWALDLNTLRWKSLPPPNGAPPPPARDHVQMARDPVSGITVIRGHSLGNGQPDETWHFDTDSRSWTLIDIERQPKGADHGLFCAVEAAGGLVFLDGERSMRTWLYQPRTKTWTQLKPGGQLPTCPIDHAQIASDGQDLYVLGGFGGDDVPADAGLTPRGALWMLPAEAGSDR